jgi:hypothetical protein
MTGDKRREPTRFAIGDPVVAKQPIGVLRARVPQGTRGVIAGVSPAGELEVQFANGRVELIAPDRVAAA